MEKMFDKHDAGCFADGGLGHNHVRQVLADLVRAIDETLDLEHQLTDIPSDDLSEESDALDLLNAHTDGCEFIFDAGDLLLIETELDE